MELGIYSFAEATPHPDTGEAPTPAVRLQHLMEEIELADEVGLDVFGLGEHHRPEYVSSTPVTILAAAAERTQDIRLTSAVTVLGSDDPVRVFQDFATLDLLSNGRAEIMAGRGSFIESFPLFGYDLKDYDELFSEKLDLLLKLRETERITWSGKHRPPLENRGIYPRPIQEPIPVWIAVGGTPASAERAGEFGLPMALGIIGGRPDQFAPIAELHRRAARDAGHEPPALSINSHGFIADSEQEARDTAYEPFAATMERIGKERGWGRMSRKQFEASCSLQGANFVGSPKDIIDKIMYQHKTFGHDRFMLQFTVGTIPHEKVLRSIELFGREVAPKVREAVSA